MNTDVAPGARDGRSSMRISDDNLRRRTIVGRGGAFLGEIRGHLVCTSTWRLEAFRVRLQPEVAAQLGLRRSLLVDVPIHVFQWVGENVVLMASLDGLRQVLTSAKAQPGGPEAA